jgi:hypothetical protein
MMAGKPHMFKLNVKVEGGNMNFVEVKINEGIATVVLSRGKVNSLKRSLLIT